MTHSTTETVRYGTTQETAQNTTHKTTRQTARKSVRITARWARRATVPILLAFVVVVDQASKWWAWRHVPWALINFGGDALVGPEVGEWYAAPTRGALLDLFDVGVLSVALFILVRRKCPAFVLVPGALVIGGWGSNLLDRLGMHYWTAPGSVRGAVDFIHLGNNYYNVADFFIVLGTPVLLLALAAGHLGMGATDRPAAAELSAPKSRRRPRPQALISALAGAGALVVIVGMGAVNYGGVTAPATPVTTSGGWHADSMVTANGVAGE
jgi:lipoprotein signal peptidase